MPYYGNLFQKYVPHDISKGVFQKNYFKIPNFVSFKGSSSLMSSLANETVVVEQNSEYWRSNKTQGQNFTVSFSKHLLKLKSISMKSCIDHYCVNNLDVYGSNEGSSWEFACKINVSKTYFQTNINNAACVSKYLYRQYCIVHVGPGMDGGYSFPIYYLELFGELYNINTKILTMKCNHYFRNYLISLYISLILR